MGFSISLLVTVNLFRIEKSPWQTNQHHDHSTNLIIVKKIICRWHCAADCLSLPSDIQYCSASLHSRLDMHKNRFNTLEPLWKSNLFNKTWYCLTIRWHCGPITFHCQVISSIAPHRRTLFFPYSLFYNSCICMRLTDTHNDYLVCSLFKSFITFCNLQDLDELCDVIPCRVLYKNNQVCSLPALGTQCTKQISLLCSFCFVMEHPSTDKS